MTTILKQLPGLVCVRGEMGAPQWFKAKGKLEQVAQPRFVDSVEGFIEA